MTDEEKAKAQADFCEGIAAMLAAMEAGVVLDEHDRLRAEEAMASIVAWLKDEDDLPDA